MAIRFGVCGIDAIVRGVGMASAVFCLLFSVFGLAFVCLSIVIFNFNRSAFLEVDQNTLQAAFGWGEKISVSLDDIVDAYASGQYLVLWTKQKGQTGYVINGLKNAVDIGIYILNRIPAVVWEKDLEEEAEKLRSEKKKFYILLCATIACMIAMFANIGLCVWLTDEKNLSDFTKHDDMVFLMFVFVEIITMIVAFLLASRCGVAMRNKNRHAFTLIACKAFENRKNGLEKYSDVDSVWYYASATQRVVIYRSGSGYGYMLEGYKLDKGWMVAYPTPYTFETYEELYEDISFRFSDVILEKIP